MVDAFPAEQRGLALGINVVAAIGGQFLGLLVGGLLADTNWRLVFWINVPIGLLGTVWAYWKLHDAPTRLTHKIDWAGNLTFGAGLILLLTAITYGIQPYGNQVMAWRSPFVLSLLVLGVVLALPNGLLDLRNRSRSWLTGMAAALPGQARR